MMDCFYISQRRFRAGQTVFEYGADDNWIGILQKGRAKLIRVDRNGESVVLERLGPDGVFGPLLAFPYTGSDSVWLQCDEDCEAVFIPYSQITKRCEKACRHHSILVENLFGMMRQKAMALSERVEVLSRRTIREKLCAYFLLLAAKSGRREFCLPFSYSALGDFICTDRSAMMRQLRQMKEDGLIQTEKRKIYLTEDFLRQMGVAGKI
ncbi:MAG: Crp/Fnr family transcriptional regulator [Oscillospiraceae bacterium]|nr:Crp/Fnr family transcriptional regulator [Oscillospiraceae bacterium]